MKDKGTLVVISGFSGAGKELFQRLSLKSLATAFLFQRPPVSQEKVEQVRKRVLF